MSPELCKSERGSGRSNLLRFWGLCRFWGRTKLTNWHKREKHEKIASEKALEGYFSGQNNHFKGTLAMARAYRHFVPGYIWHITHRCHKRESLLKFAKDRYRWMELLFEAKMKFRLSILNFIVTSNHIHLVLSSKRDKDAIPRAMQLIACRTAQECNRDARIEKARFGKTAIMQPP